MEVINCIGDSYTFSGLTARRKKKTFPGVAPRKASYSERVNFPKRSYNTISVTDGAILIDRSRRTRPSFDALSFLRLGRGRLAIAAKQLDAALSKPLDTAFRMLPVLILCIALPFGIVSVMNRFAPFTHTVNIGAVDDLDSLLLEAATADFAAGESAYFDSDGNVLFDGGIPAAIALKDSVTFQNYTVKRGDTISGISLKFGLSNISTLIAVNNIDNVRTLYVGEKLTIPSMDGLIHRVQKGDTLESIAKKYNIAIADLLDVNDLSSDVLEVGQELFIAGARLDTNTLRRAMGELFTVPLRARYWVTDRFGPRKDPFTGVASNHTGVDLACPKGTPIYASMSGRVAYTGFSSVFGNYVILNHYDGYQTLYAHMSKILVTKGQNVSQDSRIGLVGSTGYSTGPHLHFTVYKNSKLVDPFSVLK